MCERARDGREGGWEVERERVMDLVVDTDMHIDVDTMDRRAYGYRSDDASYSTAHVAALTNRCQCNVCLYTYIHIACTCMHVHTSDLRLSLSRARALSRALSGSQRDEELDYKRAHR